MTKITKHFIALRSVRGDLQDKEKQLTGELIWNADLKAIHTALCAF